MLTFNHLLHAADIDPKTVFLLRHQDKRMLAGETCYRLWRDKPKEFQKYESYQSIGRSKEGAAFASFVVDPEGSVVFVSLSHIRETRKNTSEVHFDFLANTTPIGTVDEHVLESDHRFRPYAGRLIVDWGPGARSWWQRAHKQPKAILELRAASIDVEWPGYMGILITERDVSSLAANWRAKLTAAKGVYLLTCTSSGDQYVGVAAGREGFLGRWSNYAADSHGGNTLLRRRAEKTTAPLQISILEVFGSTSTEAEMIRAEEHWKQALGTRAYGLNAN